MKLGDSIMSLNHTSQAEKIFGIIDVWRREYARHEMCWPTHSAHRRADASPYEVMR